MIMDVVNGVKLKYECALFTYLLILLTSTSIVFGQRFLTVKGGNLTLNGEKVFLSGMNQAWWNYGGDFGNNGYATSKPHLIQTLNDIHGSGGNSIRVWLHVSGANTPKFNASGYVIGPGANLTRDLKDFLHEAHARNILVTLSLWNCAALSPDEPLLRLLRNASQLESYFKNALVPIVQALASETAMGIWEIMNEPEGCMLLDQEDKSEPCYDTTKIHWWDGADWTHEKMPLKNILKFIAGHAKVIHETDPKALVTTGSWTYRTITDELDRRNIWSDTCMQYAAGGDKRAKFDLYQIHTYDTWFFYLPHDPFMINATVYKADKPIIIGEFSQKRGGMMTSQEQFTWAYYHGYSGAWSWCAYDKDDASDTVAVQKAGIQSLRDKNDQRYGGRVNITLAESPTGSSKLEFAGFSLGQTFWTLKHAVKIIYDLLWQDFRSSKSVHSKEYS